MVVSDIHKILIFLLLSFMSKLPLEINLRVVKVFQILLLLLMSHESFSFLNFLLMGIIKCHHVPHRDFLFITRATHCLPSSCATEIIFSSGESSSYWTGCLGPQVFCLSCITHNTFTLHVSPKRHHTLRIRWTPWWPIPPLCVLILLYAWFSCKQCDWLVLRRLKKSASGACYRVDSEWTRTWFRWLEGM